MADVLLPLEASSLHTLTQWSPLFWHVFSCLSVLREVFDHQLYGGHHSPAQENQQLDEFITQNQNVHAASQLVSSAHVALELGGLSSGP